VLLNKKKNYNDREIIEKGSRALIKELGYSGFLRFIRQIEHNSEDYLKIQGEIYKDISLEEMYEDAKSYWEEREARITGEK